MEVINCRAQTCLRLEFNMTHYGEPFALFLSENSLAIEQIN